jgi:hypothetical protein
VGQQRVGMAARRRELAEVTGWPGLPVSRAGDSLNALSIRLSALSIGFDSSFSGLPQVSKWITPLPAVIVP